MPIQLEEDNKNQPKVLATPKLWADRIISCIDDFYFLSTKKPLVHPVYQFQAANTPR